MNIVDLKSRAVNAINTWGNNLLDSLVNQNPRMNLISKYLSKGLNNILAKNGDKIESYIDKAGMFIADENGDVSVNELFDNFVQSLSQMNGNEFDVLGFNVEVLYDNLMVHLPQNPITGFFLGSQNAIKITTSDILELKNIIEHGRLL